MPTRTGAKKATKKARALPPKRPQPLYGRPIDMVLKRGDPAEMRRAATQARTYLKNVKVALTALERRIGKG
jgi:hypothetical protein